MRSIVSVFFVLSGVLYGNSLQAQDRARISARHVGPCERYRECTRACYTQPRPTYYADPSRPAAPYCNGEAAVLGWLLSAAPGTIASAVLPPLGAGRALWFFTQARNAGVSTTVRSSLGNSAGDPDCLRCMDSCVDSLIACNNAPVAAGGVCGTYNPPHGGAAPIGSRERTWHEGVVNQTRHCAGAGALCCENDSTVTFRTRTAFCYGPSAAEGLVCAPRPTVSASAPSSSALDTALVPHATFPPRGDEVHF